ncbi:phospholipid-transporting ATPase ABCA3-like [Physella acuta]|uniref:phospholipid-transporting ATPase ABCA3-like n=1 Tax=Physella acuta TaxID=109671 RepID=UPI0027DB45B0|nr:phospholipid-transporting ATPase ABCA3-like [Physella acuta]
MMLMALTLNMVSYLGRKEFPLDFQLGVYKNVIVVAAQPEDDGLKTLYSGLRSVLPTEVQVIEPDRSKTFEKFLQDWAKNNSIKRYREELFMGFEINQPPSPSIVYYQGYYVHSEPVAVNIFLNAHIRAKLGFEYSLESGVIPCSRLLGDHDSQVYSLLIIQLAFFSLQTIIICWLIKERVSGTKKMESFTGVPIWLSWLTNFLFDLGLHVACAAILWACLLTQRTVQELTTQLPLLVCSQLLFVLDALPFCYLYQMLFVRSTLAVFVLIVFTLLDFFVYVDLSDVPESDAIAYTRLVLKSASPHTLFWYHQDLLQYPTLQDAVPVFNKNVLFTFIHAIACWILLFAVEYISVLGIVYRCIQRYMTRRIEKFGRGVDIPTATESDEDVYQERQRILHSGFDDLVRTDALILVNVSKKYIINTKVLTAVDNTCLGIPKNECFGLLGQNGAGKTTIFKILTGEYASTSGHVYFNGLSLDSNLFKIHQMMGYCPESDLLCEDLTGRESLYLFGRLRGVPESSLKAVTDDLLKAVLLEPHADEKVEYYSLGNKRKLSTALAVIGDPQFVMLDEPTSGMDAMAKRAIWDLLQNVRSLGSTLVLTSQSMEECELLCTRLTIMVGGKLMCLGSPQHLKTKYAQGYTITVHLSQGSLFSINSTVDYLSHIFKHSEIFNEMDSYLHIQVPPDPHPLSAVFQLMEKAKKDLQFEHYTVQQTSLEQVFLMFMQENSV